MIWIIFLLFGAQLTIAMEETHKNQAAINVLRQRQALALSLKNRPFVNQQMALDLANVSREAEYSIQGLENPSNDHGRDIPHPRYYQRLTYQAYLQKQEERQRQEPLLAHQANRGYGTFNPPTPILGQEESCGCFWWLFKRR